MPSALTTTDRLRAGEELVVCRVGRQEWEIHCHGGDAAVNAIIDDLVSLNCVPQPWPSASSTSSWSWGETPLQHEARQAMSQATTEFAAIRLLEQYHGALEKELRQAVEAMTAQRTTQALEALRQLSQRARLGQHLLTPWQVVLAGPPNVGKSSLINAITGFERSLVFDQPGTTRDVVQVRTAIRGWPVMLSDTAGLRATPESLEAVGIAHAERQIEQADLILNVIDVTTPTKLREEFQRKLPNSILVINKADLRAIQSTDLAGGSTADLRETIETSTVTGAGLSTLLDMLAERLVGNPLPPGCGIPFLAEHQHVLDAAVAELVRGETDAAIARLNAML